MTWTLLMIWAWAAPIGEPIWMTAPTEVPGFATREACMEAQRGLADEALRNPRLPQMIGGRCVELREAAR